MIVYKHGDIFQEATEAIVNPVNTVGIMGKGLALKFKKRYPKNYQIYKAACQAKTFTIGQILMVTDGDLFKQKIILNFPTKLHWKNPSTYEYLISGLAALKNVLLEHQIQSVAIPALGCGLGGLDWQIVKKHIETTLADIKCQIIVYNPI